MSSKPRNQIASPSVADEVQADARVTAETIAVFGAVRRGACCTREVAEQTGLTIRRVTLAAQRLRGYGDRPDLLCCLDREPWAVTVEGERWWRRLPKRVTRMSGQACVPKQTNQRRAKGRS